MKRIVILISAVFLLGMTGCGNSSSAQPLSDTSEESSTEQQEKQKTVEKNTSQQEHPESGPVDREENGIMK